MITSAFNSKLIKKTHGRHIVYAKLLPACCQPAASLLSFERNLSTYLFLVMYDDVNQSNLCRLIQQRHLKKNGYYGVLRS